jgi:heme/copper-type cytochrome/quinol oxidase subunit 3
MEIPYTVTARKDTGLFNAKVGIWLFLASEVMLFGGLFSGYVFLRIYADYPWPERALPVLPGLINTFVLIGSSVTVVFAWAALKMRQWRRFQFFMAITIACAGIFMVLKGLEYNAKWNHQAVRMDDFTIVEGHTHKAVIDEHGHFHEVHEGDDPHGTPFKANAVIFKAERVSFSLVRAHEPWIDSMLSQAEERHSKLVAQKQKGTTGIFLYGALVDFEPDADKRKAAEEDIVKEYQTAEKIARKIGERSLYIPDGTPLSYALLKKAREIFIAGRAHNAEIRTGILRAKWKAAHANHPDKGNWEIADEAKITPEDTAGQIVKVISTLAFGMDPPVPLVLNRSWIKRPIPAKAKQAELRDDTTLAGALQDSPLALAVDAVDFRWMAQKAIEADKDPMKVIESSWIFSDKNEHAAEYKKLWKMHKKRIEKLEEHLVEKYKRDKLGNPKRVSTETERYRMGWKDLLQYAKAGEEGVSPGEEKFDDLRPSMTDGFTGPDHKNADVKRLHAFPELKVPHEKVAMASAFTPKWNTYYAIYFTLTGLHGLHVIGGALVLGYYLLFSKGLYRRNPEWLANRVEVGGLFWHFVDLIWIFLFPILYLM